MSLFGPPDVDRLFAKRDVSGLIEALGYEKEASVRQTAAAALGRLGDPSAVEPLAAVLRDWHLGVRDSAAGALVHIGQPAVPPLVAELKDRNDNVRFAAAVALEAVGLPADPNIIAWYVVGRQKWSDALALWSTAVEPLINALNGSQQTKRRGRNACRALPDGPSRCARVQPDCGPAPANMPQHSDVTEHANGGLCHADEDRHTDIPGVEFPL